MTEHAPTIYSVIQREYRNFPGHVSETEAKDVEAMSRADYGRGLFTAKPPTRQGWHFLPEDRQLQHTTRPVVMHTGDTVIVNPPIKLCVNGLHGSKLVGQALLYAAGPVLTRCAFGGDAQVDADKFAYEWRSVIDLRNIESELENFYQWAIRTYIASYAVVYWEGVYPFADFPTERVLALRSASMAGNGEAWLEASSLCREFRIRNPLRLESEQLQILNSIGNPPLAALQAIFRIPAIFDSYSIREVVVKDGLFNAGQEAWLRSVGGYGFFPTLEPSTNVLMNELERRMRLLFGLDTEVEAT